MDTQRVYGNVVIHVPNASAREEPRYRTAAGHPPNNFVMTHWQLDGRSVGRAGSRTGVLGLDGRSVWNGFRVFLDFISFNVPAAI